MPIAPTSRWLAPTLRQAAWAPALVLGLVLLLDGRFDAFTRYPWFDIPAHVLGGLAVAHFFWCASAHAQAGIDQGTPARHAALALAGATGMSLLWEAFEFAADRGFGAHMQHGGADTASDIFFSLAGGLAYLLLRRGLAATDHRPG